MMQATLDGMPLPQGVQVILAGGPQGRVHLRGPATMAAQLEALVDGGSHTLELLDSDGSPLAKATVQMESFQLIATTGEPVQAAVAEAHGAAQGAMPNGRFHS